MANELEKTTGTDPTEVKGTETKEVSTSELEAKVRKLEEENDRLRKANTNASADASKWKKQYQEADEKYKSTLSDEEQKKIQLDEQLATLKRQNDELLAERNVANHKSKLQTLGFEEDLALEVAQALNEGKHDDVFTGLRKFIAAHDKALKESAFRNNPTLQGGGGNTKAVSKEEFDKMGYKERLEVFERYPDLYQEYTK